MTRETTQRDILQVLQESWPTPLRVSDIARRAGYTVDTVRENLKLMDTVMHDLRYKIPRWRPKYKYLKHETKTHLPKETTQTQQQLGQIV